MPPVVRRAVLTLVATTGLLVITVTLVIGLAGWNWLRAPIGWVVSRQLGRPLAIQGDLHVALARQARVTARRIVLANAPWGAAPNMVEIGQLTLTVSSPELLRGRVVLPEVVVSGASVLLERDEAGVPNWPQTPNTSGASGGVRGPVLGRVRLEGGVVRYRDRANRTSVDLDVSAPQLAPPGEQVVALQARGEVLGRAFSVRRLAATVGPDLGLVAEGVLVANAPWGSRPIMVEVDRATMTLDLARALSGQLVVREIQLTQPNVLVETNRSGEANWRVSAAAAPPGQTVGVPTAAPPVGSAATPASAEGLAPLVGRFEVQNGTLTYRDPRADTDVTLTVDRVGHRMGDGVGRGNQPGGRIGESTAAGAGNPAAATTMGVKGQGRYRGARFALAGRVGTLLAIQDQRQPYPVDVVVEVGGTRGTLRGTLLAPLLLRGLNVDLTLEGPDLGRLYPFIPVPLPETPPYRLAGRLERVGQTWTFAGFRGRVGDSDLAGDFSVDLGGVRPRLSGDLVSTNLEFKDLAPLVGGSANRPGPASSVEERQATARASRDRVLPDSAFRLERLRAADADVRFRGQRVIAPAWPLDDLTAHLRLEDGRLLFEPLAFGVAGGAITATVTMDGGREPLASAADVTVRDLDLQRLFPGFKLSVASAGLIGGSARVTTEGASIAQMLGSMNGDVTLAMTGGRVSKLFLELADLDVAGSTALWVTGDRSVPVRCLVADFHGTDGRMKATTLVLDSPGTRIDGEGTIDFKDEVLDLRVQARSKRPSLIALRGPIRVRGHFGTPTVRPEATHMTLRAGAAAALGFFLTPAAAVLPFLELGVAKDADCDGLLARARERVAVTSTTEAEKLSPAYIALTTVARGSSREKR
jgi:uncharacterized protein involved in outer membrane biogenesis